METDVGYSNRVTAVNPVPFPRVETRTITWGIMCVGEMDKPYNK